MMHPTIIKIIGIFLYVIGGAGVISAFSETLTEDLIISIIAGLLFIGIGIYLHICANEIKEIIKV